MTPSRTRLTPMVPRYEDSPLKAMTGLRRTMRAGAIPMEAGLAAPQPTDPNGFPTGSTGGLIPGGMPKTGAGPVGTAANPSPSIVNPPKTGLTPVMPGQNAGGTITRGGQSISYPPSPRTGLTPARPNQGGTITTGGQTITVPPSPANAPLAAPAPTPVVSPTTSGAPQTESNNPLTGGGNQQPEGSTGGVDPARAVGFSQRGNTVPQGTDAQDGGSVGGTGLYARKFATPGAAGIYDAYVKRLFSS